MTTSATSSVVLYEDQLSPAAYVLDITPGTSGLDLTTVSSATFYVFRRGDNSEDTWTATRSAQTATTLTLTHLIVATDIDAVRGTYDIYAKLTLNDLTFVKTIPRSLTVKGKFEG